MDTSYFADISLSELEHYGVKGMKWGVRKDRPIISKKRKAYSSLKTKLERAFSTSESKVKFTDNSKMFLKTLFKIPLYMIPGGIVVALAMDIAKDAKYESSMDIDYVKLDGPIEKLSKMKRMKPETPDESLSKVNISKAHKKGTFNNCVSCAIAMDMRSKGYDVRARRQGIGFTNQQTASMYKGGKFKHMGFKPDMSPNKIFDETCRIIAKDNKGNSSGIFTVDWKVGGGHAYYYKSINGEVDFYDAQVAKKRQQIDHYFVRCKPDSIGYIRTDNLKPSDNIGKHVVSVGTEPTYDLAKGA